MDNQNTADDVAAETSQNEETTSAPLEVESSTDAKKTEETLETSEKSPSKVDPLEVLEKLELDEATKKALKDGFLRQADYTRKTQELAEQRHILEEYKQVRPVLEFLSQNPQIFNSIVEQMTANSQSEEDQAKVPEDPVEYAQWVKKQTIDEILKIQAQEKDFQEAAQIDERLSKDEEFAQTIARMVASDVDFRNGNISAKEATKRAIEQFDRYIAKVVNETKQSLTKKAMEKRYGSSITSLPGKIGGRPAPKSIIEAAQMAEEELAT